MQGSNTTLWSCFLKLRTDEMRCKARCKASFVRKVLLSKLKGSSCSKCRSDIGTRRTGDAGALLTAPCAREIMQLHPLHTLPLSFPMPCTDITCVVQSTLDIGNALDKNHVCFKN